MVPTRLEKGILIRALPFTLLKGEFNHHLDLEENQCGSHQVGEGEF
jgi:hypothetical protein